MNTTQKIAGSVFLIGLFLLFSGVLYEARALLLKSCVDCYLYVIHMTTYETIAIVIGTITMVAFLVFVLSTSSEKEEEEK